MAPSFLRRMASESGVVAGLDWLDLRRPLARAAARLEHGDRREARLSVQRDVRACREPYARICDGIGHGEPGNTALMISSFTSVEAIKLEAVLALAIRSGGYRPVIVEAVSTPWIREYHELFEQRDFVDFRHVLARSPRKAPSADIEIWRHGPRTVTGLLDLRFRGVDIGRIALSNLINRHRFLSIDLSRGPFLDAVVRELWIVCRNVIAAEKIVDRFEPRIGFVLEKGISPAAEIFGLCLARDVPVVQYLGAQRGEEFTLKRYTRDNRHLHPNSLDAETWRGVKNEPAWRTRSEAIIGNIRDGYVTGSWFDRKYLHHDKRLKPPEEVRRQLGLNPEKKTAVIFSHVLWDATFFYGENLFDDYEKWLLETVRVACANPKVNWVIKLHPDLTWKLSPSEKRKELRDRQLLRDSFGPLSEHVRLVPPDTDISTFSFFDITDYCLTVRGTAGIEMACFGKSVLTAGTGRYSHLGFTIDSNSREEYLRRLRTIEIIPSPGEAETRLARLFAYVLFEVRPWRLVSFRRIQSSMEHVSQPLSRNLTPCVENAEQFTKGPDIEAFVDWIASGETDFMGKTP